MKPTFLRLDEVIEIHRDQIIKGGGTLGIRDIGYLQSALFIPSAVFSGRSLHGDIFEMASAYLFHIIHNRPFLNGNKRVGLMAAVVFLLINGIEIQADEASLEALVRGVAEERVHKGGAAEFFRRQARKVERLKVDGSNRLYPFDFPTFDNNE